MGLIRRHPLTPAQLLEARLANAEVVSDLMEDGGRDLIPQLSLVHELSECMIREMHGAIILPSARRRGRLALSMRVPTLLLLVASFAAAQTPLRQRLVDLAKEAHGKVYVSCSLPGVKLDCDLDPHGHPPMQSTFKFPLALAVLQQVELGKLQIDQPVRFRKSDRSATFSPLQDEFPDADVDVPLRKLIKLTIEASDNTAADIQLRLIGGPAVLQHYLDSLGLSAIHQQDSEHALHRNQKLQYRNYAEPAAMVALLRLFADHSPINQEHTALLTRWMLETTSGPKRIKGLLPAGTPVVHKTGSSGVERGMIPATNDVGLITLPDGRRLAMAVFVTDAHADQSACEHVIAAIAKAVYDEALTKEI
ncbi:MAG: class A beta-lactamase [Holophaga sp.]|nr:class A beta-lactamase [Holophaga sp.]